MNSWDLFSAFVAPYLRASFNRSCVTTNENASCVYYTGNATRVHIKDNAKQQIFGYLKIASCYSARAEPVKKLQRVRKLRKEPALLSSANYATSLTKFCAAPRS